MSATSTSADAKQSAQNVDLKTLLTGPAPPNISKEIIDFSKTALPMYSGSYAVILDSILTSEECTSLLAAASSQTSNQWERAMINIGNGRQALYSDVRNCGRIIWDDREIVARLWARCEPFLDELLRLENCTRICGFAGRDVVWKMTRLNERMRFLKYVGGEYFKTHCGMSCFLVLSHSDLWNSALSI
jgi:hypothetical protein